MDMDKPIKKITFTLILVCISLSAHAEVYKWTDENGNTHYSDKPIKENSKKLSMQKEPSQKTISEAKNRASLLMNHQRKIRITAEENSIDKKKKEKEMSKQKNKASVLCEKTKRNILKLGHRGASYTTNEKNERHYLTDLEKNNMIFSMKESLKNDC